MNKPNFVLLNGFAGAGKSTLGKKYISEHSLALLVEGDEIIVNIGDWIKRETEARQIIFELIKGMVAAHLSRGYDVVLPYLVVDSAHIDAFEQIAAQHEAQFFNFLLFNERDEAINRLMQRGTWGEAGLDPLSEKDLPDIEALYDKMETQLERQRNIVKIDQQGRNVNDTYDAILQHISSSRTSTH